VLPRLIKGRTRGPLFVAQRRARNRVGSARTPALGPDTPRRDRCEPAELMAKSGHRKPENLRRYFKPSPQSHARHHQPVPPRSGL